MLNRNDSFYSSVDIELDKCNFFYKEICIFLSMNIHSLIYELFLDK